MFESIYYKHILEQSRKKLDDMVLLGYHQTGGYKLFNTINKQTVVSKDAVFDESDGWSWTSDTNEQYSGIIIVSEDAETREKRN